MRGAGVDLVYEAVHSRVLRHSSGRVLEYFNRV